MALNFNGDVKKRTPHIFDPLVDKAMDIAYAQIDGTPEQQIEKWNRYVRFLIETAKALPEGISDLIYNIVTNWSVWSSSTSYWYNFEKSESEVSYDRKPVPETVIVRVTANIRVNISGVLDAIEGMPANISDQWESIELPALTIKIPRTWFEGKTYELAFDRMQQNEHMKMLMPKEPQVKKEEEAEDPRFNFGNKEELV